MYQKILITLEATATDRAIIDHIKKLAKCSGSQIILLHVATGPAARWNKSKADDQEVREDNAYLQQIQSEFTAAEIPATCVLAFGDPATEIIQWVTKNPCDLVAMSTHGHRLVADLILGATASRVQHSISVPVLMLRAK